MRHGDRLGPATGLSWPTVMDALRRQVADLDQADLPGGRPRGASRPTIENWWACIEAFLHTQITNAKSEGYNGSSNSMPGTPTATAPPPTNVYTHAAQPPAEPGDASTRQSSRTRDLLDRDLLRPVQPVDLRPVLHTDHPSSSGGVKIHPTIRVSFRRRQHHPRRRRAGGPSAPSPPASSAASPPQACGCDRSEDRPNSSRCSTARSARSPLQLHRLLRLQLNQEWSYRVWTRAFDAPPASPTRP